MKFTAPVSELPVQKTVATRLQKLGIEKVSDLLFHFPARYEDRSNLIAIKDVALNKPCCIQGTITELQSRRTPQKGLPLVEALVQDDTATITVIWFGQKHIAKRLAKGGTVSLFGTPQYGSSGMHIQNPDFEILRRDGKPLTHTGRIVPIYPETRGVSSRLLRWLVRETLEQFAGKIPETLPDDVCSKAGLPAINTALQEIHFPTDMQSAEHARRRFQWEDILLVQLSVLKERATLNAREAPDIRPTNNLLSRFTDSLPFSLTGAQERAIGEVMEDMAGSPPMNRMLQGDVGSGKTVVAVIAALSAVKAGFQTAFMAPTEVLAKQHFQEVSRMLAEFRINIGLLTGSQDHFISKKLPGQVIEVSREKLIQKTAEGEVDILIGTHTLITGSVSFASPGLVILDEQHRFGVEQRAKLGTQGSDAVPHLLSMTATPIPRTMALTVYGDLDMSIIDELPAGRKQVITEIGTEESREEVYERVREELAAGQQAFVICPRITADQEETDDSSKNADKHREATVPTVEEEHERLQHIFPEFTAAMLHGRMSSTDKERTMEAFKKGDVNMLVSTSVVEVGVDVPTATVMIIEGADRFGLAQLHQLRGRVGRGKRQAYCFVFPSANTENADKRLRALKKSTDGFALAEQDMKIRGPGTFFGTAQSGLPDLAMEALTDIELTKKVSAVAHELMNEDASLQKWPVLRQRVNQFRAQVHTE